MGWRTPYAISIRRNMVEYILHWKSLLVVSTSNFEDIAFEFVANCISWDFLTNLQYMSTTFRTKIYPLVHECAQTTLIFDFDELLTAIGRICDLHRVSLNILGICLGMAYVKLHPANGVGVELVGCCRNGNWKVKLPVVNLGITSTVTNTQP